MPLPISGSDDLAIAPETFNENGLAVLILQGGRYGGDWTVKVTTPNASQSVNVAGQFETGTAGYGCRDALLRDPRYPYLAIETAFIWLHDQVRRRGWRLVSWECLNSHYGPGEAPYFCGAQAIVASEAFVPAEDVTYADEQTLDAVMGYSSQPS